MKRILPILLLLSALPAFAQRIGPVNIAANLTCVTLPINSQTNSVVKISVTGTFSATLQPEIVVNGNPATNTNTTPEASTTAQSTITAAGVYNTPVAGADAFVLCSTSYASGTAVVSINASNGPNASLLGGGGGAGVTSVGLLDSTNLFNVTGTPVTTTGTLTLSTFKNENAGTVFSNNSTSAAAPAFNPTLSIGAVGGTLGSLSLNGTTSGSATVTTNATGSAFQSNVAYEIPDNQGYTFSQNATGTGTVGAKLSVLGTGATEAIDFTGATSTFLVNSGGKCAPTTAVTLAASPTFTAICTWTLPNVAKTWAWQCQGTYSVTSGTTPNLQLGFIVAQAPTNVTGTARASSVSAGTTIVETNNLASTAGTTQQTMLTSATLTTVANGAWSSSGSIQASATSGTLIINASMGGTLPVGSINVGSTCWLY